MIFNGSPINPGVKKELLQKVLASKNVQIQKQQQQQLLLNQNKSKEIEDDEEEEEEENNCEGEENSFVVTPDYIQQSKYLIKKLPKKKIKLIKIFISAIKNALKQENLNPEIEEKLLTLQRYQERQKNKSDNPSFTSNQSTIVNSQHIAQVSPATVSAITTPVKSGSSRKRPPSRSQDDDDDWILDTPKRRPPRNNNSDRKVPLAESTPIAKMPILDLERGEISEPIVEPLSPVNYRKLAAIKRESDKKKTQQQLQVSF